MEENAAELTTVQLWNGPAPRATGSGPEDVPILTVCPAPAETATGAGVVLCPGGGFNVLVTDREGLHVAQWFNEIGVTVFMLRYRLRTDGYDPAVALVDGKRAVRYVRHHAAEYGVSPDRIGMSGFSAGSRLSSWVALTADDGDAEADDPIERESCRPDFLVLAYAPVGGRGGNGLEGVTKDFPPTFLFHTQRDQAVGSDGAWELFKALRDAGVNAEFHLFGGYGPHGVGLAAGHPTAGRWPELAHGWLRDAGLLTGARRAAVRGTVTIDGEPMPWGGWVTLVPEDAATAPIAAAMVTTAEGGFTIDAEHGPVPGPHRVEVRMVPRKLHTDGSPWRDTILLTKAAPDAADDMTFVVKGAHNTLNIDIRTDGGAE